MNVQFYRDNVHGKTRAVVAVLFKREKEKKIWTFRASISPMRKKTYLISLRT
jgi:hypothetical protein